MGKTIGDLEGDLRDILSKELSGGSEETTLEKVFQETLDKTTPDKSGDLRLERKLKKEQNYWI